MGSPSAEAVTCFFEAPMRREAAREAHQRPEFATLGEFVACRTEHREVDVQRSLHQGARLISRTLRLLWDSPAITYTPCCLARGRLPDHCGAGASDCSRREKNVLIP